MTSIGDEYTKIIKGFEEDLEHTSLRQDSKEYQDLLSSYIQKLISLKNKVYNNLTLFSKNESLEDLSTSSIKFLAIDYYLGLMFTRKQSYDKNAEVVTKNRIKLAFLEKAIQLFIQFLLSLEDYEILDPIISKKIDSFKQTFNPTMEELYPPAASVGGGSSNELNAAYAKRQQKIEMFQYNKQLAEKLELLESRVNSIGENDRDEILRDLSIQRMKQFSYSAFHEIEQILFETELLKNFLKSPSKFMESTNETAQEKPQREATDQTGYTERLETLNKPLLSKNGKVLRNFTLIGKRQELQGKVRGYGQYAPTMTIEEFLEKEWEEGRVLQGGPASAENQSTEIDEDDYKQSDIATYKAREWDEFKDTHPRGSGNRMNMG